MGLKQAPLRALWALAATATLWTAAAATNVTLSNQWFSSNSCGGSADFIVYTAGCTVASGCTETSGSTSISYVCSQNGVVTPAGTTYAYVQAYPAEGCGGTPDFQAAFKLGSCVFVEGPNIAYKYTSCSGTNIVAEACVNAQHDCSTNCTTGTTTGACAFTSGAYATIACYASSAPRPVPALAATLLASLVAVLVATATLV